MDLVRQTGWEAVHQRGQGQGRDRDGREGLHDPGAADLVVHGPARLA
jgi:hypothetical protein